MLLDNEILTLLVLGFFVVAALYSSVGFGGGSSYLALLSVLAFSFFFIRSNALVCNIAVVSGSTFLFYKKGHFSFTEFLPFIITSVPMAFVGALFVLDEKVFFSLLGITLMFSALSLLYQSSNKYSSRTIVYPKYLSYLLGVGIGFLSGLIGIGGGIFLAPILNHLKWGEPVKIAALAAFFILVNSLSGLTGLVVSDALELSWSITAPLLFAVLLGGQLGVRISLWKASPKAIKRATAILVLFVGLRVLLTKGG